MTLQRDAEFVRSVQRRQRLNEQLEASRVRVDAAVEEIAGKEASATDIAHLEGLLKVRRDLLNELVELDDSFMTHLLDLLGGIEPDSPGPVDSPRITGPRRASFPVEEANG